MSDILAIDRTAATAGARPRTESARPLFAKRILIVLHDFSGGGTERVAIRLANQWARSGREVRIFCGSERGPVRAMVDPEVAVEQACPPVPRGRLSRIRLGFALARAAAVFAPDAVFAPGNFHLLALAAFAVRDSSRAATFCKISNPLMRADRRGPAAWTRRLALRALTARVDMLTAMSPALRDEAARLIGHKRIRTQWEPLFEQGVACAQEVERDRALIVAAGRLEPQKNFALAIEAMAHLSRWTDARLVILGEGSERADLRRLVERLGLEGHISLPGHVGDIRPWLLRAGCFLMTSRYEGYPASLVEALACAAPAVVTRCSPALEEIVQDMRSAAVVDSYPHAIAAALHEKLTRQYQSPATQLLVERHDEAGAAASYLSLIDETVAHRRRCAS